MALRNAVRQADLRVCLLLTAVGAVAILTCTTEIWFMGMMILAACWLCLGGHAGRALGFAAAYAGLVVLAGVIIGVRGLETLWVFCNIGRHMLIPIAFATGLTDAPTGTLLAVFSRLRLPKAFGISTVVLLRFFPTIGYELSAIRSSLKFRGIGVGFWGTLAHLPGNFEHTLVPMLIRTTRISEELSAAAMVRGVRLTNAINPFDEVRFTARDGAVAGVFCGLLLILWALDKCFHPEVALWLR